ncbi:MAG: PilZ domain-containing protein [Proteobacteria bacterium]|nr:PilZ domain-containing protein [Pseudomonadota bacterium]
MKLLIFGLVISISAFADVPRTNVKLFGNKKFDQSDINALIGMGTIVFLFILFSFFNSWLKTKQLRQSHNEYQKRKEATRLQQLDISAESLQIIQDMAAETKKNWEDLLSSNHYFEVAVNSLQKKNPQSPLLTQIPGLRDELGFIFFNRRVPFITSKMIQPGQKVRVGVTVKGKGHSYVAAILNSSEDELWVKPPTVKGKTVNLAQFKQLDFSVFRKNDGEYRFSCNIKSQITTPVHAVITHHVNKIKKLQTREYERYALKFKRKFFFITGIEDENSKNGSRTEPKIGTVVDISVGGMKIYMDKLPEATQVGSAVLFFLKEAKIKKEIQARIVRLGKEDDYLSVHVQFSGLTELSRLHLQKFIASKKPVKLAAY